MDQEAAMAVADVIPELAINLKAGPDDIERAAGKVATKAAERASSGALKAVGGGLGAVAAVNVAADATTLVIDGVDPGHEARSAKGGNNVVSQGVGAASSAIDDACNAVGSITKAESDALKKVPVLGGVMALPIDATRAVGALAQNTVVSTANSIEDCSNAVGNEVNGSRSVHSKDIGEDTVLKSDDVATAIGKQGLVGLWKKVSGGDVTEEEAKRQNYEEAASYVDDLHSSGSLTDAQFERAAQVAGTSPDALVTLVNDVRHGDRTLDEAFGYERELAPEPSGGESSGAELEAG